MKKQLFKQKRIIPKDNFYPNFDDGTVKVTLKKQCHKKYSISVWGDDDFGMEIELNDFNYSLELFDKISDGITHKQLKELGFVRS